MIQAVTQLVQMYEDFRPMAGLFLTAFFTVVIIIIIVLMQCSATQ